MSSREHRMPVGMLFEPISIGAMNVKNRIVMPAMCTHFPSENGAVTGRLVDYHVERAKGGVGLIVVEATCVDNPVGRIMVNQLRVDDDEYIAGLNDLVEAVHVYGAKIALQLAHAGRQTSLEATKGRQPVSASEVPLIDNYGLSPGVLVSTPRSLRIEEINDLRGKFAEAATRAKQAGFDAVEIHGAHGYLIEQFLSPYTNKRTDPYGEDANGRMRFSVEVLQSIRKMVGDSFPIIFRLSAEEYVRGGLTVEDTRAIAERLEETGIDALHVSAAIYESEHMCEQPMAIPRGCLVHLAKRIKDVVDIPVITVGRINDPLLADQILQEGKADLVAMGRALIADPELPRKFAEGKLDEIRKCIACNDGCISRLNRGLRISCTVNPAVGKENTYRIRLAKKPKRILIVGGGPAGMEAARVSSLRGHDVTLYEEKDELGGQLTLAAKPPHKEELKTLSQYLTGQIEKLRVEVELGKKVTPNLIEKIGPQVAIIATGATPMFPNVLGVDNECVVGAWQVLADETEVGDRVVVIGGGRVGCETAEFLAEKNREITIIEASDYLAFHVEPYTRWLLLQRLQEHGIKAFTNSKVEEIDNEGVLIVGDKTKKRFVRSDSVVLASGVKANDLLAEKIKESVPELHKVGDCVKPRGFFEAIREGSSVARLI